MKKIEKSLYKKYHPTVLYREDLDFIETTLKEKSTTIEIVTEDYKYDSIEELVKERNGILPKILKLTSHQPHISVDVSGNAMALYSSDSDNESAGIFWKIDKCIKKSAKLGLFSFVLTFGFGVFFMVISILLFSVLLYSKLIDPKIYMLASIGVICIYSLIAYNDTKYHSQVSFNHRGSLNDFWDENKGTLLIQIIAGLILLLVGYMLGIAR